MKRVWPQTIFAIVAVAILACYLGWLGLQAKELVDRRNANELQVNKERT